MKILLVRPVSDTYIISPPIGLGYIATAIRRSGMDPDILDCAKEKFTLGHFRKYIEKNKPDLVGFQLWSCDIPQVKQSLKIIKESNHKIITIIGGAHPSGDPEGSLKYFPEVDFGFRGEGERGIELLVNKLLGDQSIDLDSIPGLIWRDVYNRVHSNPLFLMDDLNSFGFPAWDLIPPAEYPNAPHQGFAKAFPIAPVITTRGCPFNCSFCASHSINGRKVRFRSVDHVLDEMELLKNKYGVEEFHIEDDNFTINKEYVKKFCNGLRERDIKTHWHCSSGVRLDSLNPDILRLMKDSGCYNFTVAIESGSDRILELMKKNLNVKTIREKIEMMNRTGSKPTGLFMIGFPGETIDEIEETIKFSKSLDIKRAQFAIFHPMPGSQIWDDLLADGKLKNLDWGKIRPSDVAYQTDIPANKLKRLQRKAFLTFHFRPRILWLQVKDIHSWGNLLYLLKRLLSMLF